jgi:hypothetical protein
VIGVDGLLVSRHGFEKSLHAPTVRIGSGLGNAQAVQDVVAQIDAEFGQRHGRRGAMRRRPIQPMRDGCPA